MKYKSILDLTKQVDKAHPIYNIEKITVDGKSNSEWLFDHIKDVMEIFKDSLDFLDESNISVKKGISFYIHKNGRDVNIFAYSNECPIGILQLEKNKNVYIIQNVYVLKDHRRQGVATLLYDIAHENFKCKSSMCYTTKGLHFILKYYANSTIKDLRNIQEASERIKISA